MQKNNIALLLYTLLASFPIFQYRPPKNLNKENKVFYNKILSYKYIPKSNPMAMWEIILNLVKVSSRIMEKNVRINKTLNWVQDEVGNEWQWSSKLSEDPSKVFWQFWILTTVEFVMGSKLTAVLFDVQPPFPSAESWILLDLLIPFPFLDQKFSH